LYEGHGLLKPSIAYCMCRIANIQAGDVVMDPMCGVGTIILEAGIIYISSHSLSQNERTGIFVM
jgi:23S rRNA G2445 N2-methylase RlmL